MYILFISLSQVCAITIPGAGQFPKDLIEDISTLTGSYLFDASDAERILSCKIEDLGSASKVICSQDETFFVGSGGRQDQINKRIEQLKEETLKSDKYSQTQISIYKVKNPGVYSLCRKGYQDLTVRWPYFFVVETQKLR